VGRHQLSVEEEIDRLIQNDKKVVKKHFKFNKRNFLICFGAFAITSVLMLMAVVPMVDKRFNQFFFGASDEIVSPLGDANGSAYHYWYAPSNSFGISETKTVNWSYFKQLFLAHTDWMLEYKRYSYSSWTDGNQYMTINRTWNDTGFWKFNLIFDVPVDVYSARFTFGCDLPVLQYVERSGYEVWINYTANATETYSCMFNWSDIASIPGLVITKDVQDNMFWFRFRRDNISAGYYEFDPIFGYNTKGATIINFEDDVVSGYFQMGATGGTGDNITVYVATGTAAKYIECALYDSAKTFVNETESIQAIRGANWYTFNFLGSPSLTADAWYYICVWGEAGGGNNYGYYQNSGGNGVFKDDDVYDGIWAEPLVAGTTIDADGRLSIYCSYTEGAAGEQWNDIGSMSFNISWSNSSVHRDIGNMNFNISWSNSSVYRDIGNLDFNISFGNISATWRDLGSMNYNISFSNSSSPLAWYPIGNMYFNISFSNSSPPTINITLEYPNNNSNIQDTQPSVYFNLTSPQGYTMNYSVYIGNGSGNCTILLHTGVNVSNGTQWDSSQVYYNATEHYEDYYWRVQVNDGYSWINETYNFESMLQGGGYVPVTNAFPIAAMALGVGIVALAFVLLLIKKWRREDEST